MVLILNTEYSWRFRNEIQYFFHLHYLIWQIKNRNSLKHIRYMRKLLDTRSFDWKKKKEKKDKGKNERKYSFRFDESEVFAVLYQLHKTIVEQMRIKITHRIVHGFIMNIVNIVSNCWIFPFHPSKRTYIHTPNGMQSKTSDWIGFIFIHTQRLHKYTWINAPIFFFMQRTNCELLYHLSFSANKVKQLCVCMFYSVFFRIFIVWMHFCLTFHYFCNGMCLIWLPWRYYQDVLLHFCNTWEKF